MTGNMKENYFSNRQAINNKKEMQEKCEHVWVMTQANYESDYGHISTCPKCNKIENLHTGSITIHMLEPEDQRKILLTLNAISCSVPMETEDFKLLCIGYTKEYKKEVNRKLSL
jgi:hypothetical protein